MLRRRCWMINLPLLKLRDRSRYQSPNPSKLPLPNKSLNFDFSNEKNKYISKASHDQVSLESYQATLRVPAETEAFVKSLPISVETLD